MNRTEVITGSAIALLAAVGIGQLYLDKGALRDLPQDKQVASAPQTPAAPVETQPISADEVVSGFMTSLEQGSDEQKFVALTGLLDELEGPTYAKSILSDDTGEPLAKAAIAAVSVSTDAETPEIGVLRGRVAGFVASRTHGPSSKEYVLKMLDEGTPEIRAALVRNVGRPHGVRGKAVFEKIKELGEKSQLPAGDLVGALERLGGKKGIEPILAQLKAADQWKSIGACVTALEDYQDPALLGPAFERLDQTGLLEKNDKMPWISSKLFTSYMEKAEGAALRNGLRAAKTRPSLVKNTVEAVNRGLASTEPETRRVAAEAVRKAVIAKVIDAKIGEGMLAGRIGSETEPVLKAEFSGALEQVRGVMPKEGQQ
jgi:hypothetical protein